MEPSDGSDSLSPRSVALPFSNDVICGKKNDLDSGPFRHRVLALGNITHSSCVSLASNRGSFKFSAALPRGVTRKHPRSAFNAQGAESNSHCAEPDYPSISTTTQFWAVGAVLILHPGEPS